MFKITICDLKHIFMITQCVGPYEIFIFFKFSNIALFNPAKRLRNNQCNALDTARLLNVMT